MKPERTHLSARGQMTNALIYKIKAMTVNHLDTLDNRAHRVVPC